MNTLWHMTTRVLFAIVLLFPSFSSAKACDFVENVLFKKYKNLDFFHAKMTQTKESTFLVKPLITQVEAKLESGALQWKAGNLPPLEMTFDREGHLNNSITSGAYAQILQSPAAKSTIESMRRLFVMSPDLKTDFSFQCNGREVELTPKQATSPFLKIKLVFDANTELVSLLFVGTKETTSFQISSLKFAHAKPQDH